jgi:hypothetical protein
MAGALGRTARGRRAAIGALLLAGTAAVLATGFAGAVQAHGRGSRGGVYFSFGAPDYYPPSYYYGPRYYYPPPPVVYAPPPVTYAPPAPAAAPAISQDNCREYQAPAVVGGEPGNTYGTACLQPDGSWRIVR